jgi:hypothetical protein
MLMLERSRHRASVTSRCWSAVIVLAICSLTMSLATRFTVAGATGQNSTTVKSELPDAKRQHLLANAFQWNAPTPGFTLFQPPRPSVLAVSVAVPSINLRSETWLYNRPPPSR